MHPKTPDRVKLNAKKAAARIGLRLLQAVEDGQLFFEGTYRHRSVAISQGMEGLRRIVKEQRLRESAQRLRAYRQRGYITEVRKGRRRMLTLTERGWSMKFRLQVRSSPKRRDGKLLILAFDVPEKHAAYRQTLRGILRSCGFTRLQNSVWITQAEAEEPLTAWVRRLQAEDWVRLFLAEAL